MYQSLIIDGAAKARLNAYMQKAPPLISFEEEPSMVALAACFGLQSELGVPSLDRLSQYFGVECEESDVNPWLTRFIIHDNEIGLEACLVTGGYLHLLHADLPYIIDPLSLGADGKVKRAIFFPRRIADFYRRRGLNLVIVRDWILASALCLQPEQAVNYLVANNWELTSNISAMQLQLIAQNSLAFFGTHDIADHLLGFEMHGITGLQQIASACSQVFSNVEQQQWTYCQRVLAYTIGIFLDDLVQPRWYASQAHLNGISACLDMMRWLLAAKNMDRNSEVPLAVSHYISAVRQMPPLPLSALDVHFETMVNELIAQAYFG